MFWGMYMTVWVLQALCSNSRESENLFLFQVSAGICGRAENSQHFLFFFFLHEQQLTFHFFFREENQFYVKMHQVFLRQNTASKNNFESVWNVLFCQVITGRKKMMAFWSILGIVFCKSLWWSERDVGHDLLAQ